MLKINGVAIVSPKSFTVDISDQDGQSNRNAKMELFRDRVAIKRKLSISWGALKQSDTMQILNAVSDVFFQVEYLDPQFGKVTKTMYVGDRSAAVYIVKNGIPFWEGLEFNLIEK